MDHEKLQALLLVLVVYLLALALSISVANLLGILHPLKYVIVVDIAATCLVFIGSYLLKNSSLYDPYWSVIPVWIVYDWTDWSDIDPRQLLILILIVVWSIRLTGNWIRSWRGLQHEDWRYGMLAVKTGKYFWPVSFAGIHLFPTMLVLIAMLPVYFTFQEETRLGYWDVLAALITTTGILIEAMADRQLWKFRKKKTMGEKIMMRGLWGVVRHPNYLGEILFWIGLFAFVPASGSSYLWTIAGPIAMILLFVLISIPMMERKLMKSKKGYSDYCKNTPALIPRIRMKDD